MIARLERTYGVIIRSEFVYDPYIGKTTKLYNIISADGCPWEKGLSYRGLLNEFKTWGNQLLEIKAKADKIKGEY